MSVETSNPKIDKRDFDKLFDEFIALIPDYTPGWEPLDSEPGEDVGLALAKIFCRMMELMIHRLNRVPEKYFMAFLDTLGIKLLPSRPAIVPVTFLLAEGTKEHVLIPAKTQVAAGEIIFETEKNILATPAKLTALYGFTPRNDAVYDLMPLLNENPSDPFEGENLQEHALYLGHKDMFNITGPSNITLNFDGDVPESGSVDWEYSGQDSEGVEKWLPLIVTPSGENQWLVLNKNTEDEITKHEIQGIKNRWIRCKVKDGSINNVKNTLLDTVKVVVSPSTPNNKILPDMAFCNDVPIDLTLENGKFKTPLYPFGKIPRPNDVFYIAGREAFSKKGANVTLNINIEIEGSAIPSPPCPMLSWEYWDGKGWLGFSGIEEHFKFNGKTSRPIEIIINDFPTLQPIEINGQENYWIRIRLVAGHFGQEYIIEPGNKVINGKVDPPRITSFSINYEYPEGKEEDLEHVLIRNNLAFKDVSRESKTAGITFSPFQELGDHQKSLYLGSQQKLEKGPISIFFSLQEQTGLQGIDQKVRWFYYSQNNEWINLEVLDNTHNLTRSGTMEFLMPPDFAKTSFLGKEMHWIKAVDVQGKMQTPPVIKGIYVNTVWVLQAESIHQEILGSSSSSANQTFKAREIPVLEEIIRINETGILTDDEKLRIIKENGDDFVSEIKDDTGKVTETWVRWQLVKDFWKSSSRDRHYVIDRAMGEITFGNGLRGMVPPLGIDNIKISYRTGGGQRGNIALNEISTLKTSIPFIETVTNYQPAEGGSDTEQLPEVFRRGPHLIKHRNRAVTPEDFQRLAGEASSYIARTKCIVTEGKIKIIVIPKGEEDKPTPSPGLLRTVEQHIRQRCLNTVSPWCIQMLPPAYVPVDVTAVVVPISIDIAVPLERTILKKIKEFFHPLTGGPEKNGWEFGRDVYISDIYAMLERIEGVDHVDILELNGSPQDLEIEDMESLVCSGKHDITMKFGG